MPTILFSASCVGVPPGVYLFPACFSSPLFRPAFGITLQLMTVNGSSEEDANLYQFPSSIFHGISKQFRVHFSGTAITLTPAAVGFAITLASAVAFARHYHEPVRWL